MISKVWLIFEYLAFLISVALALRMTTEKHQQRAVVLMAALFLQSYAWLTHVGMGQLYIFIPFCAMAFYFLISRKQNGWTAVLAGLIAAVLILIRPNTVLFFLPFLMLMPRYQAKYKFLFAGAFCVVFIISFYSSQSRYYWSDYRQAMGDQLKLHQGLRPELQHNLPLPSVDQFEGVDKKEIRRAEAFPYYKPDTEHGNVFVILNTMLQVKTPVWLLGLLFTICSLMFCLVFIRTQPELEHISVYKLAMLGFFIYMLSDLFSPIHRFHYNAIQWLFPLLLVTASYSPRMSKLFITGAIIGLILNSMPVKFFPMEHTLGEYLLFGSLAGILFLQESESPKQVRSFV